MLQFLRKFQILTGIQIAILVQKLRRFCWMGIFCSLELILYLFVRANISIDEFAYNQVLVHYIYIAVLCWDTETITSVRIRDALKSGGFCFDQQPLPGIEHAAPTALECPEILIQPCIFNLSHPAVIRKEGKPLEECWRLVSRDGTTGKWFFVDSTNPPCVVLK